MEWEHPVHPGLAGLVTRMVGYDLSSDEASVHHGVPSPATTVILSFDEPLDAAWPDGSPGLDNPPVVDASPGVDNASGGVRRWRLASGLHVRPVLIRTHGHQHGIQLSLTPAGTRALLGVPMGALVHALADHGDLPLGIPDPLHARLAESPWQQRFALFEEHLLATVGRNRAEVPRDMTQGWALLGRRRGRLGASELANALGWSRRHLTTRFVAEFGLPPREVARLHRFATAVGLARRGVPWAQVAARAGFADQPHLVREFGAFAGQPPGRWRAEVFPDLQDPRPSEG